METLSLAAWLASDECEVSTYDARDLYELRTLYGTRQLTPAVWAYLVAELEAWRLEPHSASGRHVRMFVGRELRSSAWRLARAYTGIEWPTAAELTLMCACVAHAHVMLAIDEGA
jgi:hypothetical protein